MRSNKLVRERAFVERDAREGTLCPKLGRAAARAEGLRPSLAPMARAEDRGYTLCPPKLALAGGGPTPLPPTLPITPYSIPRPASRSFAETHILE